MIIVIIITFIITHVFLVSETRKCPYQNGRASKTPSKRSVTFVQHGEQFEDSKDDSPVIEEESL